MEPPPDALPAVQLRRSVQAASVVGRTILLVVYGGRI
jgi:hypothetical protein